MSNHIPSINEVYKTPKTWKAAKSKVPPWNICTVPQRITQRNLSDLFKHQGCGCGGGGGGGLSWLMKLKEFSDFLQLLET